MTHDEVVSRLRAALAPFAARVYPDGVDAPYPEDEWVPQLQAAKDAIGLVATDQQDEIEQFRREVRDKLHVVRSSATDPSKLHRDTVFQQCEDFLVDEVSALLRRRSGETEGDRAKAEREVFNIVHRGGLGDTHTNVSGEIFADDDLERAGQDWGGSSGETEGWQPMATAPKDGTRILIDFRWLDDNEIAVASWGKIQREPWEAWISGYATTFLPEVAVAWMPLPAPSEDSGDLPEQDTNGE